METCIRALGWFQLGERLFVDARVVKGPIEPLQRVVRYVALFVVGHGKPLG